MPHATNPVVVETHDHGVRTLWLRDDEEVCPDCKGAGYWDSCFECGNNGSIKKEQ